MNNFVKIASDILDKLKLTAKTKCVGTSHIGVYWDSSDYEHAFCAVCERELTAEETAVAPHNDVIKAFRAKQL